MRLIKTNPRLIAWLALILALSAVFVYGVIDLPMRNRSDAITVRHVERSVDTSLAGTSWQLRKSERHGDNVTFTVQVQANRKQRLAIGQLYLLGHHGSVNMFNTVRVNGSEGTEKLRRGRNVLALTTYVADKGTPALVHVTRHGDHYLLTTLKMPAR
jgi:hypothetical protein